MARKLFRRYLPQRDKVLDHQLMRRLAPLLRHPSLWHLNRHSAAGGVAIGLFAGLVPGPLQMLAAALLAIWLKRNLPVALLCTFYTNPLTIVPLYLLAFKYGQLLLGENGVTVIPPEPDWQALPWGDWAGAASEWLLAMGTPLFVGLPALALSLAAIGYTTVHYGWRWHVAHAWQKRRQQRRA
ncbi:MAG: hypothetical protein RL210_423 [Pseudomonadota bacterium]|jgi:uncharacterized protein (DUF2062 family)|nr:uncharacterized protein [Pseudomonadota bacterium]